MNDHLYDQLFGSAEFGTMDKDTLLTVTSAIATINATEDRLSKSHTLYLITQVAIRLSFIASLWWFVINPHAWYGIPIFGTVVMIQSAAEYSASRPELPKHG